MLKNILIKSAVAIALAGTVACSGGNEWTVDGRIEGADGQTMIVEASDNGRWYAIDSVKLDASGNFKVCHEASGYPDIYRLRLGDKTLYFPIDSVETVTVMSKADAFDQEYTLAGSPSAEMLMAVDRKLIDAISHRGINALANDTLLKRELGGMLLGNPAGIVSYYIINKRIGGVSIFNPANQGDLRIIGAVANAFDRFRPDDPRTAYLRNLYLSNRRRVTAVNPDTIYAGEVNIFEIKLHDNRGIVRSLKELASAGKVVLLNFTAYGAEESPAFNRELNRVYEKYRERGFEIYQVSVDSDEYQWRQAAANLPWITVYNPTTDEGTRNLLNYNIIDIPVSFVIDRKGEVVERVAGVDNLDRAVASRL